MKNVTRTNATIILTLNQYMQILLLLSIIKSMVASVDLNTGLVTAVGPSVQV